MRNRSVQLNLFQLWTFWLSKLWNNSYRKSSMRFLSCYIDELTRDKVALGADYRMLFEWNHFPDATSLIVEYYRTYIKTLTLFYFHFGIGFSIAIQYCPIRVIQALLGANRYTSSALINLRSWQNVMNFRLKTAIFTHSTQNNFSINKIGCRQQICSWLMLAVS